MPYSTVTSPLASNLDSGDLTFLYVRCVSKHFTGIDSDRQEQRLLEGLLKFPKIHHFDKRTPYVASHSSMCQNHHQGNKDVVGPLV